jgi:hypothetical protein
MGLSSPILSSLVPFKVEPGVGYARNWTKSLSAEVLTGENEQNAAGATQTIFLDLLRLCSSGMGNSQS